MNLSLCPICGKLSEEEQTALFSSLDYSTRSFKKGDWVARQGDALSSLYLLSKGRVKTEMITESGTILEVETLSAPTPLASAFLFAENNRFPVDVIALEECEIILIPKNAVMRLLATNEHFLQSYRLLTPTGHNFFLNVFNYYRLRPLKVNWLTIYLNVFKEIIISRIVIKQSFRNILEWPVLHWPVVSRK